MIVDGRRKNRGQTDNRVRLIWYWLLLARPYIEQVGLQLAK